VQNRIANLASNPFLEDLKSRGYKFIGSDGSVPAIIFQDTEEDFTETSAFPRHCFKETIALHAPIARQLKEDPYAGVATLTKKQAETKVMKAEYLKKVNYVSSSLRQLDKIVEIYVKRIEELKLPPKELLTRLLNSRLQALYDFYKEGNHNVVRDWGEYKVEKHDNQITLKSSNYDLKLIKDDHFNTIELNLSPNNPGDQTINFFHAD
jgi:hypothetical protein